MVKRLLEECGFDAAFNYKTGPVLEQLQSAAPAAMSLSPVSVITNALRLRSVKL